MPYSSVCRMPKVSACWVSSFCQTVPRSLRLRWLTPSVTVGTAPSVTRLTVT